MDKEINTNSSRINKLIILFLLILGAGIFILVCDLIYIQFIPKELLNKPPTTYQLVARLALFISGLSFLFVMFLLLLKWQSGKNKITVFRVILAFLTLPILPLYLLVKPFRKNQKWYLKIVKSLIPFVLTAPVWILGYIILYYVVTDEAFLGTRYQVAPLAESSSMIPSFPEGTIAKYHPYKNIIYKLDKNNAYKFQRGDVISFSNQTTKEYLAKMGEVELAKEGINIYSSFMKRVIALPGDSVELKAGAVFINGKPLIEPYTLEANSTYGLDYKWVKDNGLSGLFLEDCQKVTVPAGKLFVLGDNRKNSNDSRFIGFISFDDVDGYLPFEEQRKPYYEGTNLVNNSANWRDTSNDFNSKVLLEISSYCKK